MKKLLLLLLIVPLVFSGQNSKKDSIDHFKELLTEPMYGGSAKSFFKGYWIDTSGILKLAEATFGIPIFNSGPIYSEVKSELITHTKRKLTIPSEIDCTEKL